MSKFQVIGAFFGFLGVGLGAFGAHGFERLLIENGHVDTWKTATLYLFVHALALLFLSACRVGSERFAWKLSGWCWTFGTIVFSGSLFILSLTNISKLGAITPIGGVAFLVGWGALVVSAIWDKSSSFENT